MGTCRRLVVNHEEVLLGLVRGGHLVTVPLGSDYFEVEAEEVSRDLRKLLILLCEDLVRTVRLNSGHHPIANGS